MSRTWVVSHRVQNSFPSPLPVLSPRFVPGVQPILSAASRTFQPPLYARGRVLWFVTNPCAHTSLWWGVRDFCSFPRRSLALGTTNHRGSEASTKSCWPQDLGWVFQVRVLLVLVQVWGMPVTHFQAAPPRLVLAARFRSRWQWLPLGAVPPFPPSSPEAQN